MRSMINVLMVIGLLVLAVPTVGAQMGGDLGSWRVTLEATPFAEGAGLAGVTGSAHIQPGDGFIHITLEPNGANLPDGTVLEGWLVDAGRNGGPGESNVSADDQIFGAPFGDLALDVLVSAAPYALSTGVLSAQDMETWEVIFEVPNYNFSPYDAVVITLESDGNDAMGFDPRPGTPVFAGAIAGAEAVDAMGMMDDMGGMDMIDMGMSTEVSLGTTPLAANAGLEGISGQAVVYSDSATIEITIDLAGAELPAGTVLEGWIVDAGLFGGPGATSVSSHDEAFGIAFGDASFDAAVEAAPYALSTGVVADDMGMLHLTFHVPGYNFSPYDAVVITLESDGNSTKGFDPRPGTPVLVGEIGGM